MNFLAHSYLSGSDPQVLVGNFIGDFVKGRQYLDYPKSIREGILLHREIDTFTDTHEIPRESKNKLKAKYRHYSGVIVDMFYDHFLATHWLEYHDEDLLKYTENVYAQLYDLQQHLPSRVLNMLEYMVPSNWMYHYKDIEGIDKALTGMSRRTKFESHMDEAVDDLKRHYKEFDSEFCHFFPEAKKFAENYDFVVR